MFQSNCGDNQNIEHITGVCMNVRVTLIVSWQNYLQLIPGYRGYTIDSLRKLSFLDDLSISADEKHHFKGLAKRKGLYKSNYSVHNLDQLVLILLLL